MGMPEIREAGWYGSIISFLRVRGLFNLEPGRRNEPRPGLPDNLFADTVNLAEKIYFNGLVRACS